MIYSLLHALMMCILMIRLSDQRRKRIYPAVVLAFISYFLIFFLNNGMTFYFHNCCIEIAITSFLFLSYINDDSMLSNGFISVVSTSILFLANLVFMVDYASYVGSPDPVYYIGQAGYINHLMENYNSVSFLSMCIHLISAVIMERMMKKYRSQLQNRHMATTVVLIGVMMFILILLENDVDMELIGSAKLILTVSLCLIFSVLFTLVTRFSYFQKQDELEQNRLEMQIMEKQIQSADQVLAANEEIRNMRHDLKQVISTLEYSMKDQEQLRNTIQESKRILDQGHMIITGNSTLDVVLNAKRKEAEKRGIDFKVTVAFADEIPVQPADLFLALSNMIDNAFAHGVHTNPVECNILQTGMMIQMEVINGIDPEVTPVNCEEFDGIGIRTVRAISGKYDGITCFQTDSERFIAVMSVLVKTWEENL
ncbi:MAG: hypothetical protein ACI32N_06745 [Bulleidia sp.]